MISDDFEIFLKVVQKIAPKYSTGIYDSDDLQQEAYFLALDAYEKFDHEKGNWENFLSAHLSNRLKNFIRDNHTRKHVDTVDLTAAHYLSIQKELWTKEDFELAKYIDKKIPTHLRSDYLKITHGVSINKNRKDAVLSCIQKLIGEKDGI